MRYISVCSGIEAATVAWHHMGWQPAWFSEIEPFPSAVLQHHYPTVPNVGDMTKYGEWPDESVDLLVGGTPCQSFSVAGLRAGLADPRGGLMLTYLEIAQRYRPRWVVWENVPGVLSSNGGRDFGSFLGALGDLGYGWAYRVLDAQWFGVAQRRRRVFVVGHLGDWERAAKVLFERESVRRDTPPSREARKTVADSSAQCFAGSRQSEIAATLETTAHDYSRADGFNMIAQPITQYGDIAGSLTARHDSSPCADRGANVVAQPITFGAQMSAPQTDVNLVQTLQAKNPMAVAQLVAPALTASNDPSRSPQSSEVTQQVLAVMQATAQPVHYRKSRRAQSVDDHETWVEDDATNTLNCFDVGDIRSTDVVAQYVGGVDYEHNAHEMSAPTGPLLKGSPSGGGHPLPVIATAMQVRRLTPTECERLQGFSDGYTNIPWRKKPEAPDGPRYKALGNSMAVPCMKWIGERINKVDNE